MIKRPSPNFNERPADTAIDMLVLHYTGMPTADDALARLSDPAAEVSAHYV
ncbi:MAG: N-acetylmuramoyl-L-alanine amidase, partial [Rhodospirillales bacterium]|nr:N-acetylmuramoyl-L-alanine amidase [Rhodospirillales bacterium]